MAQSASRWVCSPPVTEPKHLPRRYRLSLIMLLTLCASIDPIASTSFFPALPAIAVDLQTSKALANLCSTLDYAGVAVTALYWSVATHSCGRRLILLTGLLLVVLFNVLGGLAPSIAMLIAMRVLCSAAAASIIITGVAAVSDMWETKEKGFAMSLFFLGPMASPALGPIVGGLLVDRWGWRSLQHFLAAYSAVLFLGVLCVLPETKQSKGGDKHSIAASKTPDAPTDAPSGARPQSRRCLSMAYRVVIRPLHALRLLEYPLVVLLIYLAGFSYSLTSIFAITVQSVFSGDPYNFTGLNIGLLFLPYAFGTILASLLGGKWSDWIMRRHVKCVEPPSEGNSHGLFPENRVRENAWFSVTIVVIALLSFGWIIRFGLPWYSIVVPAFLLGASYSLNVGLVTTVLVECVAEQAPMLMALNSLGRNGLAALAGSVTQPLIDAIGPGWLFTGVAVLFGATCGSVLVAIQVRGRHWRMRMWADHAHGQATAPVTESQTE